VRRIKIFFSEPLEDSFVVTGCTSLFEIFADVEHCLSLFLSKLFFYSNALRSFSFVVLLFFTSSFDFYFLRSQSADRSTSAPALSPRATPNQRTTHGQDGVPNVSVPQRSVADLAVSFQSSDGMSISTGDLDREVLECMKIQAQSRRLSAMYQKLLGAVEVESPQLGTFL